MTVSTTANTVVYRGNGAATTFAVPFKVLDEDHLQVRRRVFATGEYEHTYVGTAYSYSGLGASSGTLTLDGTALDDDYELVIERVVPYTQDLDIVNSGGFYPETVEEQLDLVVMAIQQLANIASRSITFPIGETGDSIGSADSRSSTYLGFDADGDLTTHTPPTVTSAAGQAVSTRAALASIASPVASQAAFLTEEGREGLFVFSTDNLSARVTADPSQGAYVAPDSDATGASGAWVRAATRLTPFMFGAVGDGITNDGVALQAFFDHAEDLANALKFVYDFSGEWATNQTIYCTREYETPQAEVVRRFICGSIRVLDTASLDTITDNTGRANTTVFVVRDYRNHFMGTLFIDGRPYSTATSPPTVNSMRGYSSRLFDIGVHIVDCALSTFDEIRVDGAKRDGIRLYNGAFSLRTGTAHEVTHGGTSSNNIGASFGKVNVRYSGAYGESTHGYSTSMVIAGNTGTSGSLGQRTTLTVGSSAEFEVDDVVKVRLEITSATFTSIAADNAASTLTWTAGDPVAAGLQVGDTIALVDGNSVGANDVVTYLILGFSGGSNRTITVYPAPTTEAAAAYTGINTAWSLHSIKTINSATSIDVYPWVPSRSNSVLRSAHGFSFKAIGGNTANVQVSSLLSIIVGGVLGAHGTYNPRVGTFLPEFCEIGVQIGQAAGSIGYGLAIDQIHAEAAACPILQCNSLALSVIKCPSALDLSVCRVMVPRTATSVGPMPHNAFAGLTIMMGNETLTTNVLGSHEGTHTFSDNDPLSNAPSDRGPRKLFITSPTIVLDYDYNIGRLFGGHNWAEVEWYSTTGTTPAGTATFNLSTKLTAAGWTIVGTSSLAAPPAPVKFQVSFDYTNKRVMVYPILLRKVLEGSATFDPASVANAAQTSTTVTVTGAALGDYVQVAPSISPAGIVISGHVTAADTVTVYYTNLSGGAIDLASHTIRALVSKR